MEIGTPHAIYEAAWATTDPELYLAAWRTHAELEFARSKDAQAARTHATEIMAGATLTTWEAKR